MGCKIVIKCDHHKRRKLRLVATVAQIDSNIIKGVLMAVQMSDIQKTTITVQALDAKGNPASLDGPVTFTSSDPTILTVNPTGPNTADVLAAGALGTAQAQYSADADLGPGVTTLSGATDFTIVSSQATQLSAAVGPIVDQ